jgi:hypothetical protein
MTVEDKPDVTYDEVGGAKDALEKLREVVELPLLHPERFVNLGIDPPKGVLLYGPPGTGKVGKREGGREGRREGLAFAVDSPVDPCLLSSFPLLPLQTLSARAVANRTDACFIRVIGSELVQKYVGEGARMVRELFTMARSKKACIIFFDEVRPSLPPLPPSLPPSPPSLRFPPSLAVLFRRACSELVAAVPVASERVARPLSLALSPPPPSLPGGRHRRVSHGRRRDGERQ